MYKFHCLNNISPIGLKNFTSQYEQVDEVREAQGILVRSAAMHDMEFSENLLAIARAGAGVNNIPLQRCVENGIVVFNTPGANANGVKELVFAGMLLASRDVVEGVDWVRSNWNNPDIAKTAEKEKKQFAGTELEGKKIGIIGLGAIGVRVANTAVNFGMDVYGYDPYVSVDSAWHLSRKINHVIRIEDIYAECDYITIHVPLLDSTRGMISADAIRQMKNGIVLINMARDLLVDEKAVVEAIDAGKIRRYVSDFPNPTVAGKRGCITTPHLGASTEESEINCAKMAVTELRDYLENGNIVNSVNYPNCSMGVCQSAGRISIFHKNQANMITNFTRIMGAECVNIAEMSNKSRGEVAYTLIDTDSRASDAVIRQLGEVSGVYRVRVIK
ncbi:MAG: 3-phosphoglycerate dehydrogenase family protein [Eubacteriales bacterium]|nr:3-phosphoglycerate dehydrogenase family protein [Eubacteriales bacterium]